MMVKGEISATRVSDKTVQLDRQQSSRMAQKYGDGVAKAVQKAAAGGKALNKTALVALLTTKGSKLDLDKARKEADRIFGDAKAKPVQKVGNPLKKKGNFDFDAEIKKVEAKMKPSDFAKEGLKLGKNKQGVESLRDNKITSKGKETNKGEKPEATSSGKPLDDKSSKLLQKDYKSGAQEPPATPLKNAVTSLRPNLLENEKLKEMAKANQQYLAEKKKWEDGGRQGAEPTLPDEKKIDETKLAADIDKKIAAANEYMTTVNDAKLKGKTPEQYVDEMIAEGTPGSSDAERAQLKEIVYSLAMQQHIDNPEQYVSHGFDHTVNVLEQASKMLNDNPQMIDKVASDYGVSKDEAKFLLKSVALFHDFGYPMIGEKDKAAHGIAGANLINSEAVSGAIKNVVKSNQDNPEKQKAMINALRDAVLFHSADKIEKHYGAKIETTLGSFLVDVDGNMETFAEVMSRFDKDTGDAAITVKVADGVSADQIKNKVRELRDLQARNLGVDPEEYNQKEGEVKVEVVEGKKGFGGRRADLEKKGDEKLGLEYQAIDMFKDPMQAIIRLSDNMDMQQSRFSDLQRTPAFQEVIGRLGDSTSQHYQKSQEIFEASNAAKDAVKALEKQISSNAALKNDPEFSGRYKAAKEAEANAKKAEKEYVNNVTEDVIKTLGVDDKTAASLRKIGAYQNNISFRHFGGCKAIKDVGIKNGVLTVTVNRAEFEQLNKTKVTEKNNAGQKVSVGVGEYQIWRTKEAFSSIGAGTDKRGIPKSIETRILDENGVLISHSS